MGDNTVDNGPLFNPQGNGGTLLNKSLADDGLSGTLPVIPAILTNESDRKRRKKYRVKKDGKISRFSLLEKVVISFTTLFCVFVSVSTVYVVLFITSQGTMSPEGFKVKGIRATARGGIVANMKRQPLDIKKLQILPPLMSTLAYTSPLFDIHIGASSENQWELLRLNKSKMYLKRNQTMKSISTSFDNEPMGGVEDNSSVVLSSSESGDKGSYSVFFDSVRCGNMFSPIVQISKIDGGTLYINSPDVKLESSSFHFDGNIIFKDKLHILSDETQPGYTSQNGVPVTQLNIYTNYNSVGEIRTKRTTLEGSEISFGITYPININGEDAIQFNYVNKAKNAQSKTDEQTVVEKAFLYSTPSAGYINSNLANVSSIKLNTIVFEGNKVTSSQVSSGTGLLIDMDMLIEHDLKAAEMNLNGVVLNGTGAVNGASKLGFLKGSVLKITNSISAGTLQLNYAKASKLFSLKQTANGVDEKTTIKLDFEKVTIPNINVLSVVVNNNIKLEGNCIEPTVPADGVKKMDVVSHFLAGDVLFIKKPLYLKELISGNITIHGDDNMNHSVYIGSLSKDFDYVGVVSAQKTTFSNLVECFRMPDNLGTSQKREIQFTEGGDSTLNINGITFGVSSTGVAYMKQQDENDTITISSNLFQMKTPEVVFNETVIFCPDGIKKYSQGDGIFGDEVNAVMQFENYSAVSFTGDSDISIASIVSNYQIDSGDNTTQNNICMTLNYKGDGALTLTPQTEIDETGTGSTSGKILSFGNAISIDTVSMNEQLFLQGDSTVTIEAISNSADGNVISTKTSRDVNNDVVLSWTSASTSSRFDVSFPLVFKEEEGNLFTNGSILMNRMGLTSGGLKYIGDQSVDPKTLVFTGLVDIRVDREAINNGVLSTASLLKDDFFKFSSGGKIMGRRLTFNLIDDLSSIDPSNLGASNTIESCVVFNFIHFCSIFDRKTNTRQTSIFQRNYLDAFDKSGNIINSKGLYGMLLTEGSGLTIESGPGDGTGNSNFSFGHIGTLNSINFKKWILENQNKQDLSMWAGSDPNVTDLKLIMNDNIKLKSNSAIQIVSESIAVNESSTLLVGLNNMLKVFIDTETPQNTKRLNMYTGDDKGNRAPLIFNTPLSMKSDKLILNSEDSVQTRIGFGVLKIFDSQHTTGISQSFSSVFCNKDNQGTLVGGANNFVLYEDGILTSDRTKTINIGDLAFSSSILTDSTPAIDVFTIDRHSDGISPINLSADWVLFGGNMLFDKDNKSLKQFDGEVVHGSMGESWAKIKNSISFGKNTKLILDTIDLTDSSYGSKLLNVGYEPFVPLSFVAQMTLMSSVDIPEGTDSIKSFSVGHTDDDTFTTISDGKIREFVNNNGVLTEKLSSVVNLKGNIKVAVLDVGHVHFGEPKTAVEGSSVESVENRIIRGEENEGERKRTLFINSTVLNISTTGINPIYIGEISTLEIADKDRSFMSVINMESTNTVKSVLYSKYSIDKSGINPGKGVTKQLTLGVSGGVVDLEGVEVIIGEGVSTEVQIKNIGKVGELTFTLGGEEYLDDTATLKTTQTSTIGFGSEMVIKNTDEDSWIRSTTTGNIVIDKVLNVGSCWEDVANPIFAPSVHARDIGLEHCMFGTVKDKGIDSGIELISGIASQPLITWAKFNNKVTTLKFADGNNVSEGLSLKLFHLSNRDPDPDLLMLENGIRFSGTNLELRNSLVDGIGEDEPISISNRIREMQINNVMLSTTKVDKFATLKITRAKSATKLTPNLINVNTLSAGEFPNFIVTSPPFSDSNVTKSLAVSLEAANVGNIKFEFSLNNPDNETKTSITRPGVSVGAETTVLINGNMTVEGNFVSYNEGETGPKVYVLPLADLEVASKGTTMASILQAMNDINPPTTEDYSIYNQKLSNVNYLTVSNQQDKSLCFHNQPKPSTEETKSDTTIVNKIGPNTSIKFKNIEIKEGDFPHDQTFTTNEKQLEFSVKSVLAHKQAVFERVSTEDNTKETILFSLGDADIATIEKRASVFYSLTDLDGTVSNTIKFVDLVVNSEKLIIEQMKRTGTGKKLNIEFHSDSGVNSPLTSNLSTIHFKLDGGEVQPTDVLEKNTKEIGPAKQVIRATGMMEDSEIQTYSMGSDQRISLIQGTDINPLIQLSFGPNVSIKKDFVVESSVLVSPQTQSMTFNSPEIAQLLIPSFKVTDQPINSEDIGKLRTFQLSNKGIIYDNSNIAPKTNSFLNVSEFMLMSNEANKLTHLVKIATDSDPGLKIGTQLLFCDDPIGQVSGNFGGCMKLSELEEGKLVLESKDPPKTQLGINSPKVLADITVVVNDEHQITVQNGSGNTKLMFDKDKMSFEINETLDELPFESPMFLSNGGTKITKPSGDGTPEEINMFSVENEAYYLSPIVSDMKLATFADTRINVGETIMFGEESVLWTNGFTLNQNSTILDAEFAETSEGHIFSPRHINKLVLSGYYIVNGTLSTTDGIIMVEMFNDPPLNSNLVMPLCTNILPDGPDPIGNICLTDHDFDDTCLEEDCWGIYSVSSGSGRDRPKYAVIATSLSVKTLKLYTQDKTSTDTYKRKPFASMSFDETSGLGLDFPDDLNINMELNAFVFRFRKENESGKDVSCVSLLDSLVFGKLDGSESPHFIRVDGTINVLKVDEGGGEPVPGVMGTERDILLDTTNITGGLGNTITVLASNMSSDGQGGLVMLSGVGEGNSSVSTNTLKVYSNSGFSDLEDNINDVLEVTSSASKSNCVSAKTQSSSIKLSAFHIGAKNGVSEIRVPFRELTVKSELEFVFDVSEQIDFTGGDVDVFLKNYHEETHKSSSRPLIEYSWNTSGMKTESFVVEKFLLIGHEPAQDRNGITRTNRILLTKGCLFSTNRENSVVQGIKTLQTTTILYGLQNDLPPQDETNQKVTAKIKETVGDTEQVAKIELGLQIPKLEFAGGLVVENKMKLFKSTEFSAGILNTQKATFGGGLTIGGNEVEVGGIKSKSILVTLEKASTNPANMTNLFVNGQTEVAVLDGKAVTFHLKSSSKDYKLCLSTSSINDSAVFGVTTDTVCLNVKGLKICSLAETGLDVTEGGTTVSLSIDTKGGMENSLDLKDIDLTFACPGTNRGSCEMLFSCLPPEGDVGATDCGVTVNDLVVEEEIVVGDITIRKEGISMLGDGKLSFTATGVNDRSMDKVDLVFQEVCRVVVSEPPSSLNINQLGDTTKCTASFESIMIDELNATRLEFSGLDNTSLRQEGSSLVFDGSSQTFTKTLDFNNTQTTFTDVSVTSSFQTKTSPNTIKFESRRGEAELTFGVNRMAYERISGIPISQHIYANVAHLMSNVGEDGTSQHKYTLDLGTPVGVFVGGVARLTVKFPELEVEKLNGGSMSMSAVDFEGSEFLSLVNNTVTAPIENSNLYVDGDVMFLNSVATCGSTEDKTNIWNLVTNNHVTFKTPTINVEYRYQDYEHLFPFLGIYREGDKFGMKKTDIWPYTSSNESDVYRLGNFSATPETFVFEEIKLGFMSLIKPIAWCSGAGTSKASCSFVEKNGTVVSSVKRGFILVSLKMPSTNFHCSVLHRYTNKSGGDKGTSNCNIPGTETKLTYKFSQAELIFTFDFGSDVAYEYTMYGVTLDYLTKNKDK